MLPICSSRSIRVCVVTPGPAGAIMYWLGGALAGWRRRLREAEPLPLPSDFSLMTWSPKFNERMTGSGQPKLCAVAVGADRRPGSFRSRDRPAKSG